MQFCDGGKVRDNYLKHELLDLETSVAADKDNCSINSLVEYFTTQISSWCDKERVAVFDDA